jgi:uncharacterized YccA/Bax inhibitor family protein
LDTQQLLEAAKTIEILNSIFGAKPNPWVPVIATISGVFIGSVSSFLTTYLLENIKARRLKKQITIALISEIKALLVIVEYRKYLWGLHQAVSDLNLGKYSLVKFTIKFPEHYSRVYQANVESIGIIESDIASKIIEFHQLIDSFAQDVSIGGVAAEGTDLRIFEELIYVLNRAIEIGNTL